MEKYYTPEYLKERDIVGIVSPAGKIDKAKIDKAVEILNSWGLKVKMGENSYKHHFQFAGLDEERTRDFQNMLDDESVKAIFCSRGGYGTIRIIGKLNFDNLIKKPKWIVGFSDITILHAHLSNLKIKSIHGPMPANFFRMKEGDQSLESLRKILFGQSLSYKLKSNNLNRSGIANGILTGGNLSILQSLNSTNYEAETDSKILFIEDVGEYHYRIDRMLNNLLLSGKLKKLKGLIVGSFSNLSDSKKDFGQSVEEMVNKLVDEFEYPVILNFNAGHIKNNLSLKLGNEIEMRVDQEVSTIKFN